MASVSELLPYHVTTEYRPEVVYGESVFDIRHAKIVVKVAEIKQFSIIICTWERNPSSLVTLCLGNDEVTQYNGHSVREHISSSAAISQYLTFNDDNCGSSVPDDLKDFLKDTLQKFIIQESAQKSNWGLSNDDRWVIPVNRCAELAKVMTGVVMARTKPHHAKKVRKIIEEEESSENVED